MFKQCLIDSCTLRGKVRVKRALEKLVAQLDAEIEEMMSMGHAVTALFAVGDRWRALGAYKRCVKSIRKERRLKRVIATSRWT